MIEKVSQEIKEIQILHKELRKHAVGAKIKAESWDRLTRNMDRWSVARIRYVHAFLCNLRDNEWLACHMIWTKPHINEEMWENYEWMFGGQDVLEEQKLLTRARKKLKARFYKFQKDYKEFRKRENAAKKTTTEEGAGSGIAGTMDNVS